MSEKSDSSNTILPAATGEAEMPPPPAYQRQNEPYLPAVQLQSHNIAMDEMINRRASAPSFPDELPDRNDNQVNKKWKLLAFILIGLVAFLLAVIISLSVWVNRLRHSIPANASAKPQADGQKQLLTTTMVSTATSTMWNTSTSYETSTSTLAMWATVTVIGTSTVPFSANPTPESTGPCVPGPLSLAPNFCVLRSNCDKSADVKGNDCKGLCDTDVCKGSGSDGKGGLGDRATSCCGHCGCFGD